MFSVNCTALDFDTILASSPRAATPGITAFKLILLCCRDLGAAMRVEEHKCLIQSLNDRLLHVVDRDQMEVGVAEECMTNEDVARAMSTCLTALEQAYHWPHGGSYVDTPLEITRLKFIVHHVLFLELREKLTSVPPDGPMTFAVEAIQHGYQIINQLTASGDSCGRTRDLQYLVNLLFRTSQQDITFQQSAAHANRREMEFGALHEAMYTNGTMRRMGEVFEETGGMDVIAELLSLHEDETSERVSAVVANACKDLQRTVDALADLMHAARFDLPVWGATYLRFAKAVYPSTLNGTGVDTSAIHLVDAVMGNCDATDADSSCELMGMHEERNRYLPSHLRQLMNELRRRKRSIRSLTASPECTLSQSSSDAQSVLRQQFNTLLEMHRKLAMGITVAVRSAGIRSTAAGFGLEASCCTSTVGSGKDCEMARRVNDALLSSMMARASWNPSHIAATARVVRPVFENEAEHSAGGELDAAIVEVQCDADVCLVPGDRICLRLADAPDSERTFTVIKRLRFETSTSFQLAVKKTSGRLVSRLCSWGDQPVLARVAPAPRNRHLSGLGQVMVFFAQGVASCGPITWLTENGDAPTGDLRGTAPSRTILVVCCRRWDLVPLRDQLVAMSSRQRVTAVLVMSRPAEGDVSHATSHGIATFTGRVDDYLSSALCPWTELRTASIYITGGTLFGTTVLRSLHAKSLELDVMARSGPNPDLIRAPRIKLDVYSSHIDRPLVGDGLPQVTLFELARHNKPWRDAWMGVDGFVCDVTAFLGSHPGGQSVLVQQLGLDGSALFHMTHGQDVEATAMMKSLVVGRLSANEQEGYKAVEAWVTIQNTATNCCRCVAWPSLSRKDQDDVPPTFFLTNGLRVWSRSIMQWEREFSVPATFAVSLLEGVESYCEEVTSRLRDAVKSSADMGGSEITAFFQRIARLWDGLHVHCDATKDELCSSHSETFQMDGMKRFVADCLQSLVDDLRA